MKDNLDEKIKGGIKKEETPKNIELMVDNLLDNLEKRRGKNYKKAAMAASIAFLIVAGTGMGVIASTNKNIKYSVEDTKREKIVRFEEQLVIGENNKLNAIVDKLERIEIEDTPWGEYITLSGETHYKDNSANFNKELDEKLKMNFINGGNDFKISEKDKESRERLVEEGIFREFFEVSIEYMLVDEKGYLLESLYSGVNNKRFDSRFYTNKGMEKIYITPIINHSDAMKPKEIDVTIKNGEIDIANSDNFTFEVKKLIGKTKISYIGNTDYVEGLSLRGKHGKVGMDLNKDGEENEKDGEIVSSNRKNADSKSERRKPNEGYIIISDDIADGEYKLEYADFDDINLLKEEVVEVDLKK